MMTLFENLLKIDLLDGKQILPEVLAGFDRLADNEHLLIQYDEDLSFLQNQLQMERSPFLSWQYIVQGPEYWKAKITKRGKPDSYETLGQIAAQDMRKARILTKYGLDFCCGGKKTVTVACEEKGIEVSSVMKELQEADKIGGTRISSFNDWSLSFLIDYIVNVHHYYVHKSLPDLIAYAEKLKRVHGARHPELNLVHQLIEKMAVELKSHMLNEETRLFPYIKEMDTGYEYVRPLKAPILGNMQSPLSILEKEHEILGRDLEEIRNLTNDYTLPIDACTTYSLFFTMLQEFESDMQMHIHLENNILFPKALAIENKNI